MLYFECDELDEKLPRPFGGISFWESIFDCDNPGIFKGFD